jgi:hypothetical protein
MGFSPAAYFVSLFQTAPLSPFNSDPRRSHSPKGKRKSTQNQELNAAS